MSYTQRVASFSDLRNDDALDAQTAIAVATALTAADADTDVVHVPRPLAEETVLQPEPGTDTVFAAELDASRETGDAYYARQGRRTAWLPKTTTRVYDVVSGAEIMPDHAPETEGSA